MSQGHKTNPISVDVSQIVLITNVSCLQGVPIFNCSRNGAGCGLEGGHKEVIFFVICVKTASFKELSWKFGKVEK